jgi:hypothetical protein
MKLKPQRIRDEKRVMIDTRDNNEAEAVDDSAAVV